MRNYRASFRGGTMPDAGSEAGTDHADQTMPYEWHDFGYSDRTLLARDVPEGTVQLYVVSAASRNVRTWARADAVLYEGDILRPYFDEETDTVELMHEFGGTVARHSIHEWVSEPVVRLKKLPSGSGDLNEVVA